MPRLPRVYIEEILYYVTAKSGQNETLFADSADYQHYISLINNHKKQYSFSLFSYVLMPKHLHLVIELKHNVPISAIMYNLNSGYTKSFNSKYGKKGHLFEARFKTVFVEKEPYLLPLSRHVHLHPRTANIADDPKDYPYSSYPQFLDPAKREYPDLRGEIEDVFKILNGREKAFEEYVKSATAKDITDFKKLLHRTRILGSKAFAERVEKAVESAIREQNKAPQPTRTQIIYMALSGVTVLILAVTLLYSYRARTALRSEYAKTLALYDTTLDMLRKERVKVVTEGRGADEYSWKIELAEKAREELTQARMELNGYAWNIEINQVEPLGPVAYKDTLTFKDNQVASLQLGQNGFPASNYSESVLANGSVAWETIQRNDKDETANWRGEWDGNVMKGVLRKRFATGTASVFSFKSAGERVKK